MRQVAALYVYDNELYAIEGTGKMVKDALENSARYFLSCSGESCLKGPLINPRVIGFNYDMAEGVEYEIDLTQPEGQRIRNLKWKGRPLQPEQKLRIALNNYRAGGAAGYSMFPGAKGFRLDAPRGHVKLFACHQPRLPRLRRLTCAGLISWKRCKRRCSRIMKRTRSSC